MRQDAIFGHTFLLQLQHLLNFREWTYLGFFSVCESFFAAPNWSFVWPFSFLLHDACRHQFVSLSLGCRTRPHKHVILPLPFTSMMLRNSASFHINTQITNTHMPTLMNEARTLFSRRSGQVGGSARSRPSGCGSASSELRRKVH